MIKGHLAYNCAGRWMRHGEGGSEKNRPEQGRADQRSKSLDGSKSQRGGVLSDCLRSVLTAFTFETKRTVRRLSFIGKTIIAVHMANREANTECPSSHAHHAP